MISEAILIPKIYARLHKIASNFFIISVGGLPPALGSGLHPLTGLPPFQNCWIRPWHRMHEVQTLLLPMMCAVSVSLSVMRLDSASMCGGLSVKTLPNHFGLLLFGGRNHYQIFTSALRVLNKDLTSIRHGSTRRINILYAYYISEA